MSLADQSPGAGNAADKELCEFLNISESKLTKHTNKAMKKCANAEFSYGGGGEMLLKFDKTNQTTPSIPVTGVVDAIQLLLMHGKSGELLFLICSVMMACSQPKAGPENFKKAKGFSKTILATFVLCVLQEGGVLSFSNTAMHFVVRLSRIPRAFRESRRHRHRRPLGNPISSATCAA